MTGGQSSRYQYEAKEFSSVVGDYDFHFRKYKPEWALFTQPDTLIQKVYDPQLLNRYAFERNNPYNKVDPSGHQTGTEWLIGIGIAATLVDLSVVFSYNTLIDINENPQLEKELISARENAWKGFTGGFVVSEFLNRIFGKLYGTVGGVVLTFSQAETFNDYTRKVALANPFRYKEYLDKWASQIEFYSEAEKEIFYRPGGVDIRSLVSSLTLLQKYGGSSYSSIEKSMKYTSVSGTGIKWYYNALTGRYTYRVGGTKPEGGGWAEEGGDTSSSSGGGRSSGTCTAIGNAKCS